MAIFTNMCTSRVARWNLQSKLEGARESPFQNEPILFLTWYRTLVPSTWFKLPSRSIPPERLGKPLCFTTCVDLDSFSVSCKCTRNTHVCLAHVPFPRAPSPLHSMQGPPPNKQTTLRSTFAAVATHRTRSFAAPSNGCLGTWGGRLVLHIPPPLQGHVQVPACPPPPTNEWRLGSDPWQDWRAARALRCSCIRWTC